MVIPLPVLLRWRVMAPNACFEATSRTAGWSGPKRPGLHTESDSGADVPGSYPCGGSGACYIRFTKSVYSASS